MKTVLVTGAGGFIGSHLSELLVTQGYRVRAFVHYNSVGSRGWLDESPVVGEMEILAGDIRDFDAVRQAVTGAEWVFHLAALIGIPYSYRSPLAYVRTNVEGTYNILESARHADVSNVMITSTSETYGTAQYVPIDEGHAQVGQSPYSATKIAADQLALSYWRSFELPVHIVRPFNTYGPRQSARAIIPTIISQLLTGKGHIKLGSLHPTRDLTFVEDTACGFLAVARSDALVGEATNVGMGHEISMGDLAAQIAAVMGVEAESGHDPQRQRPTASEVERLYCDNRKLCQHTDWQPRYDLESGLGQTVEWLRAHRDQYRPEHYAA